MHTQGQGREYRRKLRGIAVAQWHAPLRWRRAASPPLVGSNPGPTPRCPKIYAGYARAALRCNDAVLQCRSDQRTTGLRGRGTSGPRGSDGGRAGGAVPEDGARGRQVEAATVVRTGRWGARAGEGRDRRPRGLAGAACGCRVPLPPLSCTGQNPRLKSRDRSGCSFRLSALVTF